MADHYLPGFRAGGPIRTLSNLVEQLGQEYAFSIITRDRDLGDDAPYADVVPGRWHPLGAAQVYHATPQDLTPAMLARLLTEVPADLMYLNSFFSPRLTILPLVLRRLGRIPARPVVLAPRGEFSPGALALKPWRKRLYRQMARSTGLLRDLYWQATSEDERNRILAMTGSPSSRVYVATNLHSARLQSVIESPQNDPPSAATGPLRMVFLSRIAPMKNLALLLRLLGRVRTPVTLSVHGPIGDAGYWQQCQVEAAHLPAHIRMQYQGDVPPDQVAKVFAQHDLFAFPTRGENFGHVILESLSAGTPVLVSDRTPWQADNAGGLTVLTLDPLENWAAAIDAFAADTDDRKRARRAAAHSLALAHLHQSPALNGHRALFDAALQDAGTSA